MPKKKSVWLVTYLEGDQIVSQTQSKGEAFRIARAKARELYNRYKDLGVKKPIETTSGDGSVKFVLHGMISTAWPRVEEMK